MTENDRITEYLRNGVNISWNTENDKHGPVLKAFSTWRGDNPGVERIILRIKGIDPLRGIDIWNEKVQVELAPGKSDNDTILPYHGEFYIRFAAVTTSGTMIEDFRGQECVSLEYPAKAPRVKIGQKQAGKYRRIDIESNCWPFLNGRVWLLVNGHHQLLQIPDGARGKLTWFAPTQQQVELRYADELKKYKIITEKIK